MTCFASVLYGEEGFGPAGPFAFQTRKQDPLSRARLGTLRTLHGSTPTPAFMPVGTAASVKGVEPERLQETGSRVILANTYHLAQRPGDEVIKNLGGLHTFMNWPGPMVTDSGGFQIFSLSTLTKVGPEGVSFKSHLDGSSLVISPERAMEIQRNLGADILMVLDECLPAGTTRDQAQESLEERTLPWARRCLEQRPEDGRALFAIGQGGLDRELRQACLKELTRLPFDGFALGGLSVGEDKETMLRMIAASTELLPKKRPRYLMGVGSPLEILEAVALGVDLFDCVLPTRNARNAMAFTFLGPLRLKNARFREDGAVLEQGCPCATCQQGFKRAYLRHLLTAGERLGATLMTIHNLCFMQRLMGGIRQALAEDRFPAYRREVAAAWAG